MHPGLGTTEAGIVEPISGGEVRDRESQYRGIGHSTTADPFEAFRKSKAGSFYTRMKERDRGRDEARKSKRSDRGGERSERGGGECKQTAETDY